MANNAALIEAFVVVLRTSQSTLPESAELVVHTRSDDQTLQIDGRRIPSGSPAILPLLRLREAESGRSEGVFVCADRVRAGVGVRFEVYAWEERIVAGAVRRSAGNGAGWEIACRWCAEADPEEMGVLEVEVYAVDETGMQRKGKVGREPRWTRVRQPGLPGIPEEDGDEIGAARGESPKGVCGKEMEEEETVRWAVDVGLWVACLGLGLLLSRVSLLRI